MRGWGVVLVVCVCVGVGGVVLCRCVCVCVCDLLICLHSERRRRSTQGATGDGHEADQREGSRRTELGLYK